ncbi:DUF2982 domain-containing protein [Shewanella sp. OPT22]|nr:DUF2982 domain-containing protein [Shewanella sp. OPT22]
MVNSEVIISPEGNENGQVYTLIGAVGLLLAFTLFIHGGWFAQGLILFAGGAVCFILGIAKQIEPKVSFKINSEGIRYFHRRGSTEVHWDNIQRIDIPRVTKGTDLIELPYVAIKLKAINPVLDTVSPRLATGLLTEQRSLLMTAGAQANNEEALESYLNHEFMPLTVNDERYRGILAMFGRRCLMLDEHLGYHLYMPIDCLDREPEAFIKLIRELQKARK